MKKIFLFIIVSSCAISLNAQVMTWGWSIGDVGFSPAYIENKVLHFSLTSYSVLKFNAIIKNRISISTSVLDVQNQNNNSIAVYSFLPLEIGYLLAYGKKSGFNVSLYGRG
jgi:hypothetical protein